MQFFQLYSLVIKQEPYWCGCTLWGGREVVYSLCLSLSLLVFLWPWAVTFTSASQFFPSPMWKARWSWSCVRSFPCSVRPSQLWFCKPFLLIEGLIQNTMPCMHFKMAPFPPFLSRRMRGIFSDIHCESQVGLLEVKHKCCVASLKTGFPWHF